MNISLSAFAPENLVTRGGFGSSVPRQLAHVHTQAESGAYLRDSSRVPRRCSFIYFKPPYAIGSVPSLSSHTIAYRWRFIIMTRLICTGTLTRSRSLTSPCCKAVKGVSRKHTGNLFFYCLLTEAERTLNQAGIPKS